MEPYYTLPRTTNCTYRPLLEFITSLFKTNSIKFRKMSNSAPVRKHARTMNVAPVQPRVEPVAEAGFSTPPRRGVKVYDETITWAPKRQPSFSFSKTRLSFTSHLLPHEELQATHSLDQALAEALARSSVQSH
jgi:hypothetical protein